MTTTLDWPAILLADSSDATLLVWADFLEESGDEACRGVRELLVGRGKRPTNYPNVFQEYTWWACGDDNSLSLTVLKRLPPFCKGSRSINYPYSNGTQAEAHHTALYDAARAWVGKGKA